MTEGSASITATAGSLPPLAQLIARVYAPLRDSERSFVEEWFVTQLLNEAYLDLNARLRLYKKITTGTSDTVGAVAIPTDLVQIQNLWFSGIDSPIQIVDDDLFLAWANPNTSTPFKYVARVNLFDSVVETYPELASSTYTLEYVARPVEMVAQDDTPARLTAELVPRIVNYARAYCKWQEGEANEGERFMALYEQGLPGAPREAFRRNPGPMTLIPEAGPFDA